MSGPVDAKLDRRKRLRKRAIDSAWSPPPTLPPVQMLEQALHRYGVLGLHTTTALHLCCTPCLKSRFCCDLVRSRSKPQIDWSGPRTPALRALSKFYAEADIWS
jgi:hypothetical protein